MTKENWRSQDLLRMFLSPKLSWGEGMTFFCFVFLGYDGESWWAKDRWTRGTKIWGRENLRAPFLRFEIQKESYIGRDPKDKHLRNTTENQKENSRSMSALSFSSWYVASLCLAYAVVSISILSFFHPVTTHKLYCTVNWGCRIHQLLLCRVRPHQRVYWIWY